MPAYREEISDVHRMEPYVLQMIAGKDANGTGGEEFTLMTAVWNFVAIRSSSV